MTRPDAFAEVDPTVCDICGRDACEEHLPPQPPAVGAAADRPEGERPAPASPLTFVCATELLNMSAPVAIIEGVAWANALTVLAAESGTGKTFLLTAMAAHVSSDRYWHGRAVRHGSVAYVTYEGDAFGPRLRALRQDGDHQLDHLHMVRASDPLSPVVMRDGGEMPSKGELDVYNALQALTRHLKANNLPPVVLLIIDTVRGSLSGSEDNSEHVSAYLRGVRRLMAGLPGAAAILAHHTGWQDGETKRKRERGSSAWRGNCDGTLYLEAGDYDAEHGRAELTLTVLKARDVEKSPPLFLLRQRIELPESIPGRLEPVTSCVITSDRRSFADRQAKRDAQRMAATKAEADAVDLNVLAKVRDCPAATSIKAIRQMLAVQTSKVEESVARLISSHQIVPGERGAPYILTEAGAATLMAALR